MVLKDILSISGESGLFRFIAQGKNAIIIEHLESKKGAAHLLQLKSFLWMKYQFLQKKRMFLCQKYSI